MKRLIIVAIVLLAMVSVVQAQTCYTAGGELSASKNAVYRGTGTIGDITMSNDGTNNCRLILGAKLTYAAIASADYVISPLDCLAANGKTCVTSKIEIGFFTGLSAILTGTGCTYNICVRPGH